MEITQKTTDLVIPLSNELGLGKSYPGGYPILDVDADFVNALRKEASKNPGDDFSICVEGQYFRGRRLTTIEGEYLFFRRLSSAPWDFEKVGLHSVISNHLMDRGLESGGLVAIVGRPGQGKSTTCVATVAERLKRYGGFCLTIEDPVEVIMQGSHGEGNCIQMDVSSGRDAYQRAVMASMRASPTGGQAMVYVGEIRDGFSAANLLRGALDGRLVFTTLHAASPEAAVERLVSLAAGEVGEHEARSLMASGMKLIVHQELIDGYLRLSSIINTTSVSANIRNGRFSMLAGDKDRQSVNLSNGKPLDYGY